MLFIIPVRTIAATRWVAAACIMLLFSPVTQAADWGQWLERQLQLHPDIVAARERMNAALSGADALEKPLFNPELESEFEREGDDNNYRVGLNQTIDLWNQRGARRQQAIFSRQHSAQQFEQLFQEKLSEALLLLIDYQALTEIAAIAQQRETQIETLITLVGDRQRAGDLGQVDAELSYLSLLQQLRETAQAQAQLARVTALLVDLLPELSNQQAQIPTALWQLPIDSNSQQGVDSHPAVVAAKNAWEVLQQSATAIRRGNKATPTVGIKAGKEGEEDIIGVSVSLPLQIRNNYAAESRAADQVALAAEADYRALRRKQVAQLNASANELEQYRQSYQRWQTVIADRINSSASVLDQQWQLGDLSTADYLLALQQRTDGLLAGIELRSDVRRATINWLLQSGQLREALSGF